VYLLVIVDMGFWGYPLEEERDGKTKIHTDHPFPIYHFGLKSLIYFTYV
jgi:hypothetical protein